MQPYFTLVSSSLIHLYRIHVLFMPRFSTRRETKYIFGQEKLALVFRQTVQIQPVLDLITLQVPRGTLTSILALLVQMLPSKLGVMLVDSEKQKLMGEEMAKCTYIYVPFCHVKIFLHDPLTCCILISAQIPSCFVC